MEEQQARAGLSRAVALYPKLGEYVAASVAQVEQIAPERRERLDAMADYLRRCIATRGPMDLTFICTHNSRRSHFGQIWAQVAAAHFGVEGLGSYSGGTEATAFNPRAVDAARRAGLTIDRTTDGANPIYHVRYSDEAHALTCFSKVHDGAPNPTTDFAAVMTCSSADQACPIVRGAAARFAIPYEDPKAFDGTDREADAYDERCRQISREMLYVFANAASRA